MLLATGWQLKPQGSSSLLGTLIFIMFMTPAPLPGNGILNASKSCRIEISRRWWEPPNPLAGKRLGGAKGPDLDSQLLPASETQQIRGDTNSSVLGLSSVHSSSCLKVGPWKRALH